MIGDPSGKSNERQLLTLDHLAQNLASIREQLGRFIDLERGLMLNNADWLVPWRLIDFLRDIGKHFSVPNMLAKESVQTRLDTGISFTEFSYVLLQAYDFYRMYVDVDCTLQIGGRDQWGNITAGIDLIRRLTGGQAYGLTFPLITSASGRKFGKTEAGTVWLDGKRTSPYRLYQYFLNTADQDVLQYLKYFTLLPLEEIETYRKRVEESPESREAQHTLAVEITRMVHGQEATRQAEEASAILFGGKIAHTTDAVLEDVFEGVPRGKVSRDALTAGMNIVDVLTLVGAVKSKGEARRLLTSGGVYVNNERAADADFQIDATHLASDHVLVLRTGRKNYYLLHVD
jgi:tyrosyl-tRNA synthetase